MAGDTLREEPPIVKMNRQQAGIVGGKWERAQPQPASAAT